MNSPSPKELQLERVSHTGPVTAVATTPDDKHIVYSSGHDVHIYSIAEDKNVGTRAIFERNRVHGIQFDKLPDDFAVILWGATSFTYFLQLESFLSHTDHTPTKEIKTHDWILDARFLDQETILLVTAHNSLLMYHPRTNGFRGEHKCEEQSLLYAAQLFLTLNTDGESTDIVVASGTVFNEIQLWRPPTAQAQAPPVIPISRRLQGHEGCIFSLRFNNAGTLLASCSDDRTIRIWDVESGSQLAIGFAHIARVWDVRFVPQNTGSNQDDVYLLSSSEDTTALLWNFSKSNRKLKVQERYQGHRGKHVWSQAVSSDGTKAVTGGNDGGIIFWDINAWRDRFENDGTGVYWKELSPAVIVNGKKKRDSIKGYRCLDEDRLLITTGSGCVYLYSLSRRAWTLVFQDEKFRNYGAAASIQGFSDWVCLGTSIGEARIGNLNHPDQMFQWPALDSIIISLFTATSLDLKYIHILAHGSRTSLTTFSLSKDKVSLISIADVNLPFGFDVTTFAVDSDNAVFFLGSRQGALACYLHSSSGSIDFDGADVRLIASLRRIHDHEGVRSMRLYNSRTSPTFSEILTTGRNGVYQILRINLPDVMSGELAASVVDGTIDGVSISFIHRSILNRGWLEGSATINSNLLLWGIHSKTFSFWNETTGELIFEHNCGGANRIWDFYLPSNVMNDLSMTERNVLNSDNVCRVQESPSVRAITQKAWLMYTSKSELHFRRVGPELLQKTIRKGNHGREIRCLVCIPSSPSSASTLLVSGSEDTYINFTKVENDTLEFVHRKKQFNTGIQALVFSKDGKVMFSSAGQKEVCVSAIQVEGRDIMSVEFGGYSNNAKSDESNGNDDAGGDLRIMGIDVRDELLDGVNGYLVGLALSDSTVKLYWFNPATEECDQVASGKYTTCCLLGCKFLPGRSVLMTSATDGNIAFFRIPPISRTSIHTNWSFSYKSGIHQSGVKCMDLLQVTDSIMHLLTGGDDNAVHLTEIKLVSEETRCTLLASVLNAHTSTVTGVLFLDRSRYLSVGIDQKIKIWKAEAEKLSCTYEGYTFVPDVCGITEIGANGAEKRFVVYGTGMELLEFPDHVQ